MATFSERHGFKPVREIIQVESMDQSLRNRLWSCLVTSYWEGAFPGWEYATLLSEYRPMQALFVNLWHRYFKKPIDTLNDGKDGMLASIRAYFFKCNWFEVYDLIEFIAGNYGSQRVNTKFMRECNAVLGQEVSGYRFVDGLIAPITSDEEIAEIEEAAGGSGSWSLPADHIQTALAMLADRDSPDYRNSIKESISAVEAMCRLVAHNANATLGQAIGEIETSISLHPALKGAFEKLYGYTSNADGIRHALLDESRLDFEDAKFMLVACSAFINYLKVKSSGV